MRKILVSAYGCEPFRGSEAGVGWNWILQMARHNEMYVIARKNDKNKIEDNIPKEYKNVLHFYYYDTHPVLMKLKKREKGLYLYYWLWQIGIIPLVKKIIKKEHPDYTMHLTFGSLWMPTFLPFFKVPFIWGPLGGADGVPKAYLKELPFKQRVVQSMRYILIKTAPINPLVYFPSKAAVAIIGRTQNNVEAIPQRYRKKCHVILETAMENGNLLNERKSIQEKGCVEIISTGRLVPFKNIRMAIEVLKRIRDDGYSFHYTIVGKGSEKKQIEEMVKNYHLAENIKLVGEVPRETVMEYLKMADMYLFPSLREGGSWALMEAMAAELPVVCFDWTGTGVITDDLCANRIKPTSMKQDVDCFADAVEDLINNPEKRVAYGVHARERILNVYNWDTKGRFMDKLFDDLEGKSHE